MTIVAVSLLVVALVCAGAALTFWLLGRKARAAAEGEYAQTERLFLTSEAERRAAEVALQQAQRIQQIAATTFEEAKRIEELLVHPRFAMHRTTGRLRALRAHEAPDVAEELETTAPFSDCRKCFGKGWTARDRANGQVIPCVCVKRPA